MSEFTVLVVVCCCCLISSTFLLFLIDNFIRLGYADVMLAGGSESNLDPLTITGFSRLKALSPNTDPSTASRPFDRSRDGFVIAEGACVLVLEELSHALARNAPIIAEVTGTASFLANFFTCLLVNMA